MSSCGAPVGRGPRGLLDAGLIAPLRTSAPPKEQARVDAERPADQPQHHDGADAKATAHRKAEPCADDPPLRRRCSASHRRK